MTCGSGCHGGIVTSYNLVPGEVFTETEWMTPGFDQGINWSTMTTPHQICTKVRQRLVTSAQLQEHFFEDARIAWAVHSGRVPFGNTLPTAPPHDYFMWKNTVYWWILAGAPCP